MLCRGFPTEHFVLSIDSQSSHSPVKDDYFQVEFHGFLPSDARPVKDS